MIHVMIMDHGSGIRNLDGILVFDWRRLSDALPLVLSIPDRVDVAAEVDGLTFLASNPP